MLNSNRIKSDKVIASVYGRLNRLLVKASVSAILAMGAQMAQACPVVTTLAQVERVNTLIQFPYIYFCKQDFTDAQLTYAPTEAQLLTGGSQAISMGNTVQTFPISNSINLAGFNPSQLNLNMLSTEFPNDGGEYNKQSIFNFYTKVTSLTDCYRGNPNEFEKIKAFLRANASVFQANGGAQTGQPLNSGDDLAIIRDVPITNVNNANTNLTADITFFHTNNITSPQQWFTNRGLSTRYCWVGIGTRMDIKTSGANSANLKYSGDYKVTVGVLTQ